MLLPAHRAVLTGGVRALMRKHLAAHFDAALGITSSGGFASAWADQSGNGRSLLQATGANQPIHLAYSGTKYGWLPGVAGNYFSTPDSVANSITGDIDIRVKVQKRDWTPAAADCYAAKWNTSLAWLLRGQTTGELIYNWSADGASSVATVLSTAATGFTDNTEHWVRVTHDVDNGAGGNTVTFYTSDDGSTWTPLGTPVVNAGTTSIFNSTAIVELGTASGGTANQLNGQISRAQIYNGIDGTLAVDFDPSRWSSGSTFPASTGETWTINSTGSKPAQIVDRPSLLFDGAAHFMKTAAFTLNQPETVFLVMKQVTWVLSAQLSDGNTSGTMRILQQTSSPNLDIYAGSVIGVNGNLAVGSRGVVCALYNGASSLLQINNTTAVTGNAGAANAGGFTLGATAVPNNFANIQVYEGLLYSAALDAATRSNIIRALMSRHGVTA